MEQVVDFRCGVEILDRASKGINKIRMGACPVCTGGAFWFLCGFRYTHVLLVCVLIAAQVVKSRNPCVLLSFMDGAVTHQQRAHT